MDGAALPRLSETMGARCTLTAQSMPCPMVTVLDPPVVNALPTASLAPGATPSSMPPLVRLPAEIPATWVPCPIWSFTTVLPSNAL